MISVPFYNLDLLSVGAAIAGIGILGFLVFISDRSSASNRAFFYLSLAIMPWSAINYANYQTGDPVVALWLLRALMFTSTSFAFFLFRFLLIFPRSDAPKARWFKAIIPAVAAAVSALTLTPLVFKNILGEVVAGQVARVSVGPGIVAFGTLAFFLDFGGLAVFIYRTFKASGAIRRQYRTVLSGLIITLVLVFILNFILPAFYSVYAFIPYGAVFIFPFIAFTAFATYRHHLFNLKVATTAFLGFMVTVFTFINIVYSTDISSVLINVTAFIVVLIGSVRIVQDTLNLVRQRELIQTQEQELVKVNRKQESLLRFISHEIKGYLTKNEAMFDGIRTGDFGKVSLRLLELSTAALADTRKGVATVVDILSAADLKNGIVEFNKHPFDVAVAVDYIVRGLRPTAEEKGLTLTYVKPVTGPYTFDGDEPKLRDNVIRNIIDNSIKYTQHGSIAVDLTRTAATMRLTVTDTGVGITPEDMKNMFTEGGHGKDSIKVNVHSSGYGMFIAKSITEAHGGKMWAESEGAGKGSRFIIEFPISHTTP